MSRAAKPIKPPKGERTSYAALWRVVDGAVSDAIAMHPEYLAGAKDKRAVRNSIVKRVTGAVHGYAVQAARGRSLAKSRAAEKAVLPPEQSVGPARGPTGELIHSAPHPFRAVAWILARFRHV